MKIVWAAQASADIARLNDFLLRISPDLAIRTVDLLIAGPERLIRTPRLGQRVEREGPEEIRRFFVGDYELRYEVRPDEIRVLRIWHTRENR
jgi:plasmid stabilization system protein ParE